MSPTDSFSLFINVIDLLDMLFHVLCCVLPRTQILNLNNALDGTKKDLERAEEMGIEVQEFKKDMQMYIKQREVLHVRIGRSTVLYMELVDATMGLTCKARAVLWRVKVLRRAITISILKQQQIGDAEKTLVV
ncbi:uncharacterized protein STEHIDRAFT_156186 [Stereum hirsutum FP-91666 SS1]|uniref:uncharacterized protein n=1 Tax=Stereum hirsutum (strain FP-91666) TaxID=721885 RepID=UPI000440E87E|nr:uncharacterized protein STEHIDRAFT_156186 [Stereum hirsutum FP-91666 SS1]EIM87197.1 hypothetical protein STEHIDRAFT_156186 [Stereum hirsutum FP-91666 SS1]